MAQPPVEGRYGLLEAVDRSTIVALDPVGQAEAVVRQGLRHDIPASRGEDEGALTSRDSLVMRASLVEMA
jgi:hypothetical protein